PFSGITSTGQSVTDCVMSGRAPRSLIGGIGPIVASVRAMRNARLRGSVATQATKELESGFLSRQLAPERARLQAGFLLLAAHLETQMTSFEQHRDATRAQSPLQELGSIRCDALLNRQAPREIGHDLGQIAEPRELLSRQIADVRHAEEWQHVVHAQRVEGKIAHEHEAGRGIRVGNGRELRRQVGIVAGEKPLHHFGHTRRRSFEPGVARVEAESGKIGLEVALGLGAGELVHGAKLLPKAATIARIAPCRIVPARVSMMTERSPTVSDAPRWAVFFDLEGTLIVRATSLEQVVETVLYARDRVRSTDAVRETTEKTLANATAADRRRLYAEIFRGLAFDDQEVERLAASLWEACQRVDPQVLAPGVPA